MPPVRITISDGPTVDNNSLTIPHNGDGVEFVAARPGLEFDVHFSSTPFSGNHFHNHPPNSNHHTGKPSTKGQFKYSVTIAGQPPLDPVIIVNGS